MYQRPFTLNTSFTLTFGGGFKIPKSFLIIGCMTSVLISCGDSSTSPETNPDPIPREESRNVSYSQDIQPIFNTSCAVNGCHDAGTQESGVNLSSHDDAISSEGVQYRENVINPGNPDDSP